MEIITSESAPLDLSKDASFVVAFIANGVWDAIVNRKVVQVELSNELVSFTGAGETRARQVKTLDDGVYYWATDKSVVTVVVGQIWMR